MKLILFVTLALVFALAALGTLLPNKRSAKTSAVIKASQEQVFAKITDISNQRWRSQIESVQVVDPTSGREVWVEQPKKGPSIKFRTKTKTQPNLFAIEIVDNPQFNGEWIGTLKSTPEGYTEIEFTEQVIMKGVIPKLMSYAFYDIDGSIESYINDLKRAVE